MSYTNYVIRKNKKHLRVFLEFCFNVGYTSNMPGAPSKAPLPFANKDALTSEIFFTLPIGPTIVPTKNNSIPHVGSTTNQPTY